MGNIDLDSSDIKVPVSVNVEPVRPQRLRVFRTWDKFRRGRGEWICDCVLEAMGMALVCYAGVGAQAAFTVANSSGPTGLGSLFVIGVANGFGIAMSIVVCNTLNPCIIVTLVVFKKFPVGKAIRNIICQIIGGYVATLLIYLQWKSFFSQIEATLAVDDTLAMTLFTPAGPAGILAFYAPPGISLGLIFCNEFFTDFILGFIIFACADPLNYNVPHKTLPWLIGFSYTVAIWGYGPVGLVANTARDLSGRFAALTIWGARAWGGQYAAIAALTNFPATILGYIAYEMILVDSRSCSKQPLI